MAGVGNRKQETGNRRRLILSLKPALGIAVILIVISIIISPVFEPARESARKSSAVRFKNVPEQGVVSQPDTKPATQKKVMGNSYVPEERSRFEGAGGTAKVSAPARLNSVSQLQIIRTADLSLQVKSFQKAYDRAVSICGSVGGYVTNSSAETEERTPTSGTMVIRVPVDAFDRTVKRLSDLGVVKSRNVNGEDVTGEVVDLESRLRNKRAEEQQYLDIMNRAKRVMDIVTVSNELYRVRGEIEEAEGRLKYLKSAAAMSTINLSLGEKEKVKPAPTSSIGGALSNAAASLGRTANGLAIILVWLGVYSPFWLLPIGVVIYRRRRTSTES